MDDKQRAILYAVAIVSAFGICTYLIIIDVLIAPSLLCVAFGCYPWAKEVWQTWRNIQRDTIRKFNKYLPKCGFEIEDMKWDETGTQLRYFGQYQKEQISIYASPSNSYVFFLDHPWMEIKANDPKLPQFMEAISELNYKSYSTRISITEPGENGTRDILTCCSTILPDHNISEFITGIFAQMQDIKRHFIHLVLKERPYLEKRTAPIGFHAPQEANNSTPLESISPQ